MIYRQVLVLALLLLPCFAQSHIMLAGSILKSTRTLTVKEHILRIEHSVQLQPDSDWIADDPAADANGDGMIDDRERTTIAVEAARHIREATNVIWAGNVLAGTTESQRIIEGGRKIELAWQLAAPTKGTTDTVELIWIDFSFEPGDVDDSPTRIVLQGWNGLDEQGNPVRSDGRFSGGVVIRLQLTPDGVGSNQPDYTPDEGTE